jgi:hypothetical protein
MMFSLTRRWGRSFGVGVLLASVTFTAAALPTLAPRPARAAGSEVDKQLEMTARADFAAGRYDEAIDTFAKLYAQTLNPVYLRNIGRSFQKKREPQKALDAFQDYLAKTKSGKFKIAADERAEIEGYIKDMQALRDEQARTAAAAPPPVQPLQTTPVAATPPPASLPPAEAAPAATLTAAPAPAEESHPFYTRWWFWTVVGVVAAGGAVAIIAASTSGTTRPDCTAIGGICK